MITFQQAFSFFKHTISNWQGKLMFAIILTVTLEMIEQFCHTFAADIILLLILIAITFVGIGLHFIVLIKTMDFRYSTIIEGIFRLPLYCLYLFLIGAIGISIEHSMQIGLPILNLFISYLIAGEVFTIVTYLKALGVQVPSLLVYITTDIKNRIEGKFGKNKEQKQDKDADK